MLKTPGSSVDRARFRRNPVPFIRNQISVYPDNTPVLVRRRFRLMIVLRGSAMSPTSDAELAEQLAASERRVGELSAKYLPRTLPTTETTRPPKRCPECGESMEPGVVGVHGELWALLFVGWSYQHCWFRSGDAETKVIRSGRGRRGHRCPECGYVGISGGKDEPLRSPAGKV